MLPIRNAKLQTEGKLSYLHPRSAEHRHRGVDIPAPKGTPVVAVAAGRVTHASNVWASGFSGYGRHVAIEHIDGTHSFYAHLESVDVVPGQLVSEGERIGSVGNSVFDRDDRTLEREGGYHLHFEVSTHRYPNFEPPADAPAGVEDNRIDPVAWLRALQPSEGVRAAAIPFQSRPSLPCPHCGLPLELVAGGEV